MSRMNWPNTHAELELRDSANRADSERFDLAQILSQAFEELPARQRQKLAAIAESHGYEFRDGTPVRVRPYTPSRGIEY